MKKRILAAVLSAAMVLSFLPMAAFAGAVEAPYTTGQNDTAHYWLHPDGREYYTNPVTGWTSGLGWNATNTGTANYGQFGKTIDGEDFIEYRMNPGKTAANVTVNASRLTFGSETGEETLANYATAMGYTDVDDLKAKVKYAAFRMKQTGVGGVQLLVNGAEKSWNKAGTTSYYIDYMNNTVGTWNLDHNSNPMDGWAIVDINCLPSVETWRFLQIFAGKYTPWQEGNEFYLGDVLLVEDAQAFIAAHKSPEFTVSSGDTSITVTCEEADVLFSLDGVTFSSQKVFTQLEPETEYTLYAKYDGSNKVFKKTVRTSPYSTFKGDGAYYWLKTRETASYKSGWSANLVGASDYTVPGVKIGDEYFAKFQLKNSATAGQASLFPGYETYGFETTQAGVHESIDTDAINYVAYRIKFDNVPANGATVKIFVNGTEGGTFKSGIQSPEIYYLNNDTREVTQFNRGALQTTTDMNGWILVPAMNILTKTVDGEKVKNIESWNKIWVAANSSYYNANLVNWNDDTVFYLGDVLLLKDKDAFVARRTSCDLLGHKYEAVVTPPTATAGGYTTYTCSCCSHSYVSDHTDPLTAVQNVSVVADDVKATVSWDAFPNATLYYIRLSDAEGNTLTTRTTTELSIELKQLVHGNNYQIRVFAAYDNEGKTAYLKAADATPVAASLALAGRVIGTRAEAQGTLLQVSWDAYPDATEYTVYVYEGDTEVKSVTLAETSTAIAGLNKGVLYTVKVVAKVGENVMDPAAAIAVNAQIDISAVANFRIANDGAAEATKLTALWTKTDAEDLEYYVRILQNGQVLRTWRQQALADVDTYSLNMTNLKPNATYDVQIQSVSQKTVNGRVVKIYSGWSDAIQGTTSAIADPNLVAYADGDDIIVSWDDNAAISHVWIYEVVGGGHKMVRHTATSIDGARITEVRLRQPGPGEHTYKMIAEYIFGTSKHYSDPFESNSVEM